ncbi:hypothetical protein AB0I98_38755 [Streptomyces sp. NPDC050211]|uniref:hypothetical protein n=1 Tax=Streptomyces sp. NPDC050211 TaxID=3154932 RepID=UPI0034410329
MPLPRKVPGAVAALRRARAGTGMLLVLLALPFAIGGLTGARPAAMALGLVAGPLALLLFGELCEERPPTRHSATAMAARTLTGMRSVDLNHITSVRLLTTFSYGGTYRTLVVRDAHGVRLGVTSAAGRRALNKALERQTRDQTRRRPRVSRAASCCLGTGRPGHLAPHITLVFLAQVGTICAYVVAVLEVGVG